VVLFADTTIKSVVKVMKASGERVSTLQILHRDIAHYGHMLACIGSIRYLTHVDSRHKK